MNGKQKPDIRQLDPGELNCFLEQHGEPTFRTSQVYRWLWSVGSRSFDEMSNIPASVRNLLADHFKFLPAIEEHLAESKDGSLKILLRLHDGYRIEGVLIPAAGRTTACISSQVGCPIGCSFCETGTMEFIRNLTTGEMFDQITILASLSKSKFNVPLSNIVYMGMGEPLLNYEHVMQSIMRITETGGLGMSQQRITVSTVGIPEMVRKLGDEQARFHLALSLHAATDNKRNAIIPLNHRRPLKEIIGAFRYYHKKTQKRITVEYLMLQGFNDSMDDAYALAMFCKNFPVKINLIEYNPVVEKPFKKSSPSQTKAFKTYLEKKNLVINIRQSRGEDISAACGQLACKTNSYGNDNHFMHHR